MIEATITEDGAVYAVRPDHGKPVTFVVTLRNIDVSNRNGSYWSKRFADRFVVGLKGSTGHGFSHHTTLEAACRSAHYRARRYERAYSVPRGVAA